MEKALKEKNKCAKCKNDPLNGAIHVEEGKSYILCELCHIIVNNYPMGGRVFKFLHNRLNLSPEEKYMIKARKRRASEKSPWTNAPVSEKKI